MARIYLDEQLDTDITEMLVGYGHDAVHTYDVGNRGAPDSQQLLFAADSQRVIVTLNREDFEELHRWWIALNAWGIMSRAHSGILTTWGDIPASEWAGLVNEPSRTKPGIDQSNDAVQPTITAMAALSPALTPYPDPNTTCTIFFSRARASWPASSSRSWSPTVPTKATPRMRPTRKSITVEDTTP